MGKNQMGEQLSKPKTGGGFLQEWANWFGVLNGIKLEGILVLNKDPRNGFHSSQSTNLFSKRPLRTRSLVDWDCEYGLTVSQDLKGRELLNVTELNRKIYLLEFDGFSCHYYAIGIAPNWNHNYRMPTLNNSRFKVAVSHKKPAANDSYECTVIEKLADGNTAANRKTFELSDKVLDLGTNSGLCNLSDGQILFVTWNSSNSNK